VSDGVTRFVIAASAGWGQPIPVLRPLPRNGDPWGVLAPARETPWGPLVPVIPGETLSHALNGYLKPLLAVLGAEPRGLLARVPEGFRQCALARECVVFKEKDCHPCPRLPDCYVPPGVPPEARDAVACIALGWKEGRYVLVIGEGEFSL